ncbi:hypothetical protein [Cupriavidus sp. PET2-C1]
MNYRRFICFAPIYIIGAIPFFAGDAACDGGLVNRLGWIQSTFPPIKFYTIKSSFPCVSFLYFSLMMALAIPYSIIGFFAAKEFYINHGSEITRGKSKLRFSSKFFATILIALTCAYFCLFINPGMQFEIAPVNRSRAALYLTGWWLSGLNAGALVGGACAMVEFLFIVLRKGRR